MRRVVFVLLLAVAVGPDAPAHPGGLDARGGHRDHQRGGYHCHRCITPIYAPAPAPPPPKPGFRGSLSWCHYTVGEGDTLRAVADHFGWSVEAIVALNPGLHPDYVSVGQRLRVPARCEPEPPPPEREPAYGELAPSHDGCILGGLALAFLAFMVFMAWLTDDPKAATGWLKVAAYRVGTGHFSERSSPQPVYRPTPTRPKRPPPPEDDRVYVRGHYRRKRKTFEDYDAEFSDTMDGEPWKEPDYGPGFTDDDFDDVIDVYPDDATDG